MRHGDGSVANGPRQRFWYAFEALGGVLLHLLISAVAWTFIQFSGLMVAGCGAERSCNYIVTNIATIGIQPVLVVAWLVTTVLAFTRPLAWGRSPWPVIGVGVGISALIAIAAYVTLSIGAGLV